MPPHSGGGAAGIRVRAARPRGIIGAMKTTTRSFSRREFLVLGGASAAALAAGCATNPVTGQKEMMLMSEAGEIDVDRQNAPHQFSADYGAMQDAAVNDYIASVGRRVAAVSDRPEMPYSFRGVNAPHVNAYAFPGGSIAVTRGVLVSLESEAALAGLIGHEVGHVNYRHTARRMTKGVLTQLLVAGVVGYVAHEDEKYAPLAAGLGAIGSGLLLAHYSRSDEREADAIGTDYMVKAGYNPRGVSDLMAVLVGLSKEKPGALEVMFSTHPMSQERYDTAVAQAQTKYASAAGLPLGREAYMDRTAAVRRLKPAIDEMQKGDKAMMAESFREAEQRYGAALRLAPDDYAGLLMMAKCLLVQDRAREARGFAERAAQAYPGEPQALQVSGLAKTATGRHDAAFQDFEAYERALPGNPNTAFFKGLSLDRMGRREAAAREYARYLNAGPSGTQAQQAYGRLVEWGYVQPAKPSR